MIIPYEGCPLCSEPLSAPFLEVDCTKHPGYDRRLPPTMKWHRCISCDHVHTPGYWTDEALEIVLGDTQPQQTVGANAEIGRVLSAEIISRMLNAPQPWLEIGFGSGDFLLTAREFEIECFGLDIRPRNVEALKKLNILCRQGDLLDLRSCPDRTAILLDVIEHIPFPLKIFEKLRDLQFEAVLISTPNIEAPIWTIMNRQGNPYWHEIEHYHIFGRSKIESLLKAHGFTPRSYHISKRYKAGMEIYATRT